jgi:NADH:ubiquinone reductase (H+-translocating)
MVTQVEAGAVYLGERRMPATVVLWAAGVAASPLGKHLGVAVDRVGHVPVQADMSLPGHPEVFVIGDLAAAKDEQGRLLPGVAPVAIQQGKYVAKLIREEVECSAASELHPGYPPRLPFHYWDKGSLATIGRAAAVAQFGKIHISGFIAWLSWLFVHILFLIGFRNRLLVFIQWAWSYMTYERGARLITGSTYLPGWTAPEQAQVTSGKDMSQEIPSGARK